MTSLFGTEEGRRATAGFRTFFVTVFGVLLPAVTVIVEATTHMCAGSFFDPIPTVWHVLAAGMVPVVNAFALYTLRREAPAPAGLGWLMGFTLGLSALYALVFLPMLPMAVFALVFFGLGLLPLAPLLNLLVVISLCRRLRAAARAQGRPLPALGRGALLVLAFLLLVDLRPMVTRLGLHWALSGEAAARARGIAWLRSVGSDAELLRHCYRHAPRPADLFWIFADVDRERAREVYYRATGRAFNAVPPPPPRREDFFFPGARFDREQGGASVAGVVDGLSLSGSRLDGSVDAEAGVGYVEWTLDFKNVSAVPAEARARVALPPGGVVSRVTLWIDGEEREAAFGGRSQVRQAYEAVVRQSRDPLLVTTAGPDHVLVQCFPVPASGTMKIRLGVTAPLDTTDGDGVLALPRLVEWNFDRPEELVHSVWIESSRELGATPAGLESEAVAGGGHALRGSVPERDPAPLAVRVPHRLAASEAWTIEAAAPPPRVELVVDASAAMAPFVNEIIGSLDALPPSVRAGLILASDTPYSPDRDPRATLRDASWRGGTDNVPGLSLALERAAREPGLVVLWIHGPQPVLLQSAVGLRQHWERRRPRLLALPVVRGPNRILEELDGIAAVETIARRGTLRGDLESLFRSWSGPRPRRAWRAGAELGGHLGRLQARDEVLRLAAAAATRPEAVKLAVKHRLVTPVSGAVVLESQQQYDAAGLRPVAPQEVPTIPEPGTWAVIVMASLMLAAAAWRRRREVRWTAR